MSVFFLFKLCETYNVFGLILLLCLCVCCILLLLMFSLVHIFWSLDIFWIKLWNSYGNVRFCQPIKNTLIHHFILNFIRNIQNDTRYEDNYLILQLNISVKVSEDCSWCSIFKDKYLSQRSNRVKGMNEMQMNKEIFYFHFWYIFSQV